MSRSNLGARIELISPSARTVRFPAVSDILKLTDRIIKLIDAAKYNREALPIMKSYMIAVKEAIHMEKDVIPEEYTLDLLKALEDWERFLEQYTKPKMKTLLRFQNDEQVRNRAHFEFTLNVYFWLYNSLRLYYVLYRQTKR